MRVLTEDAIVDLILRSLPTCRVTCRDVIAFAREIEAMTLREVFKRIQPEEEK